MAGIVISRCAYCDLTVVSLDVVSPITRAPNQLSLNYVKTCTTQPLEDKTSENTVAVKSRENEA